MTYWTQGVVTFHAPTMKIPNVFPDGAGRVATDKVERLLNWSLSPIA